MKGPNTQTLPQLLIVSDRDAGEWSLRTITWFGWQQNGKWLWMPEQQCRTRYCECCGIEIFPDFSLEVSDETCEDPAGRIYFDLLLPFVLRHVLNVRLPERN